jgi:lipoyl(octanoyl) transferase
MIKVEDLGLMEYRRAWDLQREAFDRVMAGGEEVLLLTEHPHVYTLGKSGREDNMLVGETFLKKIGADMVRIDRGGDITYHGPGQLVGYPILDLQRHGMGLREYIFALEQSLIDTLATFGIEAGRSEGAAGVWLGGGEKRGPLRKIAAIGVRSSRYVTMHGFALNVDPQMEYFAHINPCGFADRGVTSMARELNAAPTMDEVKREFVRSFEALFGAPQSR